MIYFVFKEKKVIFFFHCKGGGTSFKHYLLENFLKKEYENINFEIELKNNNIHNILRKFISNYFQIRYVYSNKDIEYIKKEFGEYNYIYIHRNYKERLVSCFYNKFVELDDNKKFFNKINIHKVRYENFSFKDFIKNIIINNIQDVHWNSYPKLFNTLSFKIIELKKLDEINKILKIYDLPSFHITKQNLSNKNLKKITISNTKSSNITIKYILDLKRKGFYIDYDNFYDINDLKLLQKKFQHEIIL